MSLRYLPEHAENALLALDLARKEADHLRYTHRTLFAQPIDAEWVHLFLQALMSAREAAEMLFRIVSAVAAEADTRGLFKLNP